MAEGIGFSIAGKLSEYAVDPILRQFKYLFCYNSNIQNLRNKVKDLENKRTEVQLRVDEANRNAEVIGPSISEWLLKSRYLLSRKAEKKIAEVDKLQVEGTFERVGYRTLPVHIPNLAPHYFAGFETRRLTKNTIMEALKDKDISIIGICGMPGVGKTTMANEIAHEVKVEKLFDEVVMAVVSQNQDINKIQDQLAEMLGLRIEEKTNNIVRSGRLRERLGGDDGKRILVILDDVWEEIDFGTLGIPSPVGQKILKIMFTTRIEDVCSYMGAQRKFKVEVLPKEEAWQLFKDTAGISDHATNVVGIAKEVADECGGLPLALVIVAKALKDRNVYAWRDALKQLQNSQVTDQVYSRIELSYNYLKDDEHRSLLLLCSLFAEDESIPIETLVRYSRGLGLFQNTDTLSETRDRAYSIADNLKSLYLLLQGEDEEVKLHELVRDFCLMVASKDKHGYLVKHADLNEWPENDIHESCSAISLTFNELYKLPRGLKYENLKLLRVLCNWRLWISRRQNIAEEFFKCMKELRVLEFNWMSIQIPSSIQLLTGLRTFCFDCCVLESEISVIGSLKKLEILTFYYTCLNVDFPSEIAELSNLRSLDLRFKKGPCPLPRGILLGMKKLEELYLGDYFETRDEEQRYIIKEVSSLTCLNTFQISTDDTPFLMQILQALHFEKLERFQIIGTEEKGLSTKNNHVTRSLSLLEGIDGSMLSQPVINSVMRRTEHLQIDKVNVVKNLANELDGIINLKTLRLSNGCLEYLIDTTKSIPTGTFGKLELLELVYLHDLTQICNGNLPRMEHFGRSVSEPQLFSNLKNLYINGCGKIRSMFSETVAKCMVNLQFLYIVTCGKLEEVVSTDTIEDEVNDMLGFPKLIEVTLQDLISFKSFTSQYIPLTLFNQITLPNLEKLDISLLRNTVQVLYDKSNIRSLHKLRQMSVENLLHVSELFNFDGLLDTQDNVENVLGQLRSLELEILPKLVHITRMVPKGVLVFQNLISLVVRNCDSLRYLFSPLWPTRLWL
ncbi:Disease resistance protein [Forsythia ovata]|uniref:Disease resistance protein n=1 Tax=Forsythia ovata TaxID=205694 RepID=A0ABD1PL03_9LAMI